MPRRTRARLQPRPTALAVILAALLGVMAVPAPAAVADAGTTTTTTPTTTAPTTSPPSSVTTSPTAPTTAAHPDPDAFAALANQVTQNQALLVQLSAQVDQANQ